MPLCLNVTWGLRGHVPPSVSAGTGQGAGGARVLTGAYPAGYNTVRVNAHALPTEEAAMRDCLSLLGVPE